MRVTDLFLFLRYPDAISPCNLLHDTNVICGRMLLHFSSHLEKRCLMICFDTVLMLHVYIRKVYFVSVCQRCS